MQVDRHSLDPPKTSRFLQTKLVNQEKIYHSLKVCSLTGCLKVLFPCWLLSSTKTTKSSQSLSSMLKRPGNKKKKKKKKPKENILTLLIISMICRTKGENIFKFQWIWMYGLSVLSFFFPFSMKGLLLKRSKMLKNFLFHMKEMASSGLAIHGSGDF